jgi:hypothetical protein
LYPVVKGTVPIPGVYPGNGSWTGIGNCSPLGTPEYTVSVRYILFAGWEEWVSFSSSFKFPICIPTELNRAIRSNCGSFPVARGTKVQTLIALSS